jgi:hypothetical protein
MLRLTILRRGTPEHVVDLVDRDLCIGRGASNELLLRDPGKTVSRTHARIERAGKRWFYIDQDSLNGSWVRGQLVDRVELVPGVVITMGDYDLRCESVATGLHVQDDTLIDPAARRQNVPGEAAPGEESETHGTLIVNEGEPLAAQIMASTPAGPAAEAPSPASTSLPDDGSEPTRTGG